MPYKIDSHQHYWKVSRGDYSWLTPELKPLYRDYLPEDLQGSLELFHIDGTILVQAADTLDETDYLLELAEAHESILGVVGWVDMASPKTPYLLEHLAKHRAFLGVRPMIQDIPDDRWMLKKEIAPSLEALTELGLTFDALVFPRHLNNLLVLCERHPRLKVVIDHGAKPPIKENAFKGWAEDISAIARETHAYCKFSGLLTEAPKNSALSNLSPYIVHLFNCFGPKRIMWGSDWPVLNLASDYASWHSMAEKFMEERFPLDKNAVFGETAASFYGIQCSKTTSC